MKLLAGLAVAILLAAPATTALATSYSGNWPIDISHAKYGDGTWCLTVKDDGSVGWPHSGYVSAQTPSGDILSFGTFQLIGRSFTVTVQEPGGTQNAGAVFVAKASDGKIGKGIFDQVYGGEALDTGVAAFGAKGGC